MKTVKAWLDDVVGFESFPDEPGRALPSSGLRPGPITQMIMDNPRHAIDIPAAVAEQVMKLNGMIR